MEQTAQELAESGAVKNQQALVQRLMPKASQTVSRVIPGGARLDPAELDLTQLREMLYTQLRGCRSFTEVELCFAEGSADIRTHPEEKVTEFDYNGPLCIWDSPDFGKIYLAEEMAKVVLAARAVSVIARKDGIYVIKEKGKSPTVVPNNDRVWAPMMRFKVTRKGQYRIR